MLTVNYSISSGTALYLPLKTYSFPWLWWVMYMYISAHCDFWFLCELQIHLLTYLYVVQLSVPVQSIAWRDTSQKLVVSCEHQMLFAVLLKNI